MLQDEDGASPADGHPGVAFAALPPGEAADAARADQHRRWAAGERVPAEQYLADLPEVAADPDHALVLIYGEVLARTARGERPTADEYISRFPQWADRLALQFQLHAALAATTAPPPDGDPARITRTYSPVGRADLLATLTAGTDNPVRPDASFRFGPGNVLAKRYRIVAPLGRGGMGEVYRADDLTLGQSVALKFLPEHVAANPDTLARFRREVAAARQVAHPHVCRVFDIGEADGQVFLSMEYIPGDDLAGVLRRAGRLSSELAIDLARQIAQGLYAVHDEGLVHRDLKPANVMIDGRGRARLTDFGLAATAESVTGVDAFSGTPAYQAPEQLSGGAITERTDVYALGLLAYELLTGRRPFATADRKALVEAQKTPPPAPSTFDATIPPEVDRIVLKCLAHDPLKRPASAHEVWRALPGDAAMNAALAEGRTPSAEVVAGAGGEGRLKRRTALLLAGVIAAVTGIVMVMNDRVALVRVTPIRTPAELRQAAEGLLRQFGPADHIADTYGEFVEDIDQWLWWNENVRTPDRRDALRAGRPTPVRFLYRESPVPMQPPPTSNKASVPTPADPPHGLPGSALVWVDGLGRLLAVERVPPLGHSSPGGEPDWRPWFAAAGLDPADFRPTQPSWKWVVPSDRCAAWEGVFPERPEVPLTVEAAADRGEVVGFRLVTPWTHPEEKDPVRATRSDPVRVWLIAFVLPAVVGCVGLVLTVLHLRAGRADVRGAIRLAVAFGVVHITLMLAWFHPLGGVNDYFQFYGAAARVLLNALVLANAYLALEPFVRRRWPGWLIGWTRLLAGRVFDPRVGRDVLLGAAAGAVLTIFTKGVAAIQWPGLPPGSPVPVLFTAENPIRALLSMTLNAVDYTLTVTFVVFLLTQLLRTVWLWGPASVAVATLAYAAGPSTNPQVFIPAAVIGVSVAIFTLVRVGLLAGVAMTFVSLVLYNMPLTYDFRPWYAGASAVGLAAVVAVTLYGLVVSVGGWRRLVRADSAA